MSLSMSSIHPRFQNRLEATLQRRIADLESAYERAREGLLSASEMLASLPNTVPATVVAELRDEADRLLGAIERLRASGDGLAELERLVVELERFGGHLVSVKSALSAAGAT